MQVDELLSGIHERAAMHQGMLLRMAVEGLMHLSMAPKTAESGSNFQSRSASQNAHSILIFNNYTSNYRVWWL